MLALAAIFLTATPATAETIFECGLGARQASVSLDGERLTYRYSRRGRTELELSGDRTSNSVFYHRRIYGRAEDQTLRFVNGRYAYVVYARWAAPSQSMTTVTPERIVGGVLVMRDDAPIRDLRCRTGGDMREWPVFETLPQDPENLTPEDA